MRALVLLSGGLDSLLAASLLERQGVAVECVHFVTGFNHRRYRESVESRRESRALRPTTVLDIREEYLRRVALEVGVNGRDPCVDCRVLMLQQAWRTARRRDIGILATGEVVGQRERGQCHADLSRIEEAAGVEGRVLRPLSAAYLPTRKLERHGVGAELLRTLRECGTLQGRSRRAQFALAETLSVTAYPTPSGGCCRLTDPRFVRRLSDELQHGDVAALSPEVVELLALGRHFRLGSRVKAIVGRDEPESAALLAAADSGGHWTFQVAGGRGALGIVLGDPAEVGFEELGGLAVRYSSQRDEGSVRVVFRGPRQQRVVRSRPAGPDSIAMVRV